MAAPYDIPAVAVSHRSVRVRSLQEQRNGRGNRLLVFEGGSQSHLLKLFRSRRTHAVEQLEEVVAAALRRGCVTAHKRYETERECHALWRRHGIGVVEAIDRPLPGGEAPPGIWYRYYDGPVLDDYLKSDAPLSEKLLVIERLGDDVGRRQALALEHDDSRLVHGHASAKHYLIDGAELLAFDHEHGYRRGYPVREALVEELGGLVRSIARCTGNDFPDVLRAFVEGYGRPDVLRDLAAWGVGGMSVYRICKRWSDRRRRSLPKTKMLAEISAVLD